MKDDVREQIAEIIADEIKTCSKFTIPIPIPELADKILDIEVKVKCTNSISMEEQMHLCDKNKDRPECQLQPINDKGRRGCMGYITKKLRDIVEGV